MVFEFDAEGVEDDAPFPSFLPSFFHRQGNVLKEQASLD